MRLNRDVIFALSINTRQSVWRSETRGSCSSRAMVRPRGLAQTTGLPQLSPLGKVHRSWRELFLMEKKGWQWKPLAMRRWVSGGHAGKAHHSSGRLELLHHNLLFTIFTATTSENTLSSKTLSIVHVGVPELSISGSIKMRSVILL